LIIQSDGRKLVTLHDAATFMTRLPKAESGAPEWRAAIEALMLVAESGGPTMLAHAGALSRRKATSADAAREAREEISDRKMKAPCRSSADGHSQWSSALSLPASGQTPDRTSRSRVLGQPVQRIRHLRLDDLPGGITQGCRRGQHFANRSHWTHRPNQDSCTAA
jgi:hypothetical protein